MKKSRVALLVIPLLTFAPLYAFAAGPSITFTLDGKAIAAVPVDKLGQVKFSVMSGGSPFNKVFAGQWQGIDQSLGLAGKIYSHSAGEPALESAHDWNGYNLYDTHSDTTWGNKTSAEGSMLAVANYKALGLFSATSQDSVLFTVRFRRQVYTGKTIWVDGGWVKETRWEGVGPTLGKATLKMEPPTFASSLDPKMLFAPSLEKFNTTTNGYSNETGAEMIAHTLMYPNTYGGRTVDFKDSKIVAFELAEGNKPVYNWNYKDNGSQYVSAKFTVNMKTHSVMHTRIDPIPFPTTAEADFNCPMDITATRVIGEDTWVTNGLDYNNSIRQSCKTADGKTAEAMFK